MTREEAKTFLLQLNTDKRLNPSEHEAIRVAISALEQEPCFSQEKSRFSQEVSQEPCDAISREAVIDTLQYAWEANKDIQESIVEIKALPPVTQKSGKWTNKDVRKEEYVLIGKCSECGQVRVIDEFCSHCGCRMVEPQESED